MRVEDGKWDIQVAPVICVAWWVQGARISDLASPLLRTADLWLHS
jgi:hypothetical protein